MTVVDLDRNAQLREIAEVAGPELELAPAEAIIEWAVATFGDRFCVASSMGDAVLAHLAAAVAPGIDVVFLDTGYHFAETIGTRDAVAATMPVNVVTIAPTISVREQDDQYGHRPEQPPAELDQMLEQRSLGLVDVLHGSSRLRGGCEAGSSSGSGGW